MKESYLTRRRSADVVNGLVDPSASRSLSWIEEMLNDSGDDILEGAVVVVLDDGTIENADTLNDPRPTGVALDDIGDGETGQVCFGGPVDLVLVTASITAGEYGQTSTTPGEAQVATTPANAFCMFTASGTTPTAFLWGGRGGGAGSGSDPPNTGGDMVPYYIASGDSFTVPLYKQGLFSEPIENDGGLVVNGILLGVD